MFANLDRAVEKRIMLPLCREHSGLVRGREQFGI